MTLDEFIIAQLISIKEFETMWARGSTIDNPGIFPAELELSEWEEQFGMWIERKEVIDDT